MKKKFISLVLAAVLCVGMGTSVFAAGSITSDDVVESPSADNRVESPFVNNSAPSVTTNAAGATEEWTGGMGYVYAGGNATGTTLAAVGKDLNIPAGAKFETNKIESGETYTKVVLAVGNKPFAVFEMNLMSGNVKVTQDLGGYVNITMPIPAGLTIGEGQTLRVYYLADDGSLTPCDTALDGNGNVTFATNHFSTYVYVVEAIGAAPMTGVTPDAGTTAPEAGTTTPGADDGSAAAPEAGTSAGTTGTVTSPKTADANTTLYVTLLAVAALGGVAFAARKRAI